MAWFKALRSERGIADTSVIAGYFLRVIASAARRSTVAYHQAWIAALRSR